jgi:hypothetical protein
VRQRLIIIVILAALLVGCQSRTSTQESQYSASPVASLPAAAQPVQSPTPVAPVTPPGCTVITVISPPPTPGPTSQSLFPAVSSADWVQGPDSASLTFLEYSDFQ